MSLILYILLLWKLNKLELTTFSYIFYCIQKKIKIIISMKSDSACTNFQKLSNLFSQSHTGTPQIQMVPVDLTLYAKTTFYAY